MSESIKLIKNEAKKLCSDIVRKSWNLKKISHLFFKLLSYVKTKWEVFSNFLRISELYKTLRFKW